jgi:ferritin-like metal-binding protein YciE
MPTACGHETVISLRQAALEAGKAADKQLNDLAVQRINKPASSLAHAA